MNQGLCVCGPRAANHICQSRRGWWGIRKGGGRLTFPGLYMNSISWKMDIWLAGMAGLGSLDPDILREGSLSNAVHHSCPPAPLRAVHPDQSSDGRGRTSWPAAGAPQSCTGDEPQSRDARGSPAPYRSKVPASKRVIAQCCPIFPQPRSPQGYLPG